MPTPDGKIRWGISSTGWLGEEKMMPAIQRSAHGVIAGLVSRRPAHARAVAERFGIPNIYPDMAAMLADPQIDAVYNALPTGQHVPTVLQAVAAGKPVLCEKPLGMNAADLRPLLDLPPGHPPVMEAFMVRHHPQWRAIRALVQSGQLGALRAIQSRFCYYNDDPAAGTNRADDGGGALLYVGCYPIVIARFLWGAEPQRVLALSSVDGRFGTDTDTTGIVDFGAGRHLSFHVSTLTARNQSVNLLGTKAHASVQIPYNTPETEPVSFSVDHSGDLSGASARVVDVPAADHYSHEADAFAEAVLSDTAPPYGIADALANMRTLEAAQISAREGRWVELAEIKT